MKLVSSEEIHDGTTARRNLLFLLESSCTNMVGVGRSASFDVSSLQSGDDQVVLHIINAQSELVYTY